MDILLLDATNRPPERSKMSIQDTAPVTEEGRAQLGSQLRTARTKAKISLRELARRVGISASFMSQVELGRAVPSIGTLYTIVSELGLSLDSLMSGEHPTPQPADMVPTVQGSGLPSVQAFAPLVGGALTGIQRATDRPEINMSGVRWERLTERADPLVEFLRVTYTPGSESCAADALMRHSGWEYFHILTGQLNVQVGFEKHVLYPGDSMNFDSNVPHRLSNTSSEDCVAIWAVVGRQGFAHPLDLARATGSSGEDTAVVEHLPS
ncbi:helix-turn-helix domain-containing protein [Paenarthrobacter sp. NPDC057981]|uniref:helix-turn-helix domain-containing protein n=1 Tax=Paenarthrobacter sp. NPDC057981 TaxID=3346297 RepID=UPI0036DDD2B5